MNICVLSLAVLLTGAGPAPAHDAAGHSSIVKAARDYRIMVYNRYRTSRDEFDRLMQAQREMLSAWEDAGRPANQATDVMEWFAVAEQNLPFGGELAPLPHLDKVIIETPEPEAEAVVVDAIPEGMLDALPAPLADALSAISKTAAEPLPEIEEPAATSEEEANAEEPADAEPAAKEDAAIESEGVELTPPPAHPEPELTVEDILEQERLRRAVEAAKADADQDEVEADDEELPIAAP